MAKDKKNKPARGLGRNLYWFFYIVLVLMVVGTGLAAAGYFYLAKDLPPLYSLHNYRPPIISKVYTDDGTLLTEFAEQRRELVHFSELPKDVVMTFVASEDHRFLDHKGVDWYSVARAFIIGHGGASTITMQVARSFFLTPERSYIRKLKESILAYRIEKYLTKPEIMTLYLTQIDFGQGCYGIGAAARYYFGKPAGELTVAETAMLVGTLPAPSRLNPVSSYSKAKSKQKYVLFGRMADPEIAFITREQAEKIYAQPIKIVAGIGPRGEAAPYFAEQVRRLLIERYGRDVVYREGLQVFTTVNIKADQAAREAVRGIILGKGGLDQGIGFRRGKVVHLDDKAAKEAREKQETDLRKTWIKQKWSTVLKDGMADQVDYDTLKDLVPDPVPLVEGKIYKAVVIEVDDNARMVRVEIGHSRGRIEKKGLAWAKEYLERNDQGTMRSYALKNPSRVLVPDDLIPVKVIGKEETDKGVTYQLELDQEPVIQGALISMAVRTGHVKALCGGLDYRSSQFIRAVQAKRQPGSAFKPIVYGAAMDADPPGRYTPATMFIDTSIIFDAKTKNNECPGETSIWERYTPRNYNNTFIGECTLRDALAKSINTIAVRVAWNLCLPSVIDFARRLGLQSHLDMLPCLALGCSEVTLEEMTRAYNVYASGGFLEGPVYIVRVYDRDGNLLEYEEREPEAPEKAAEDNPPEAPEATDGSTPAGEESASSNILSGGIEEQDIFEEEPEPMRKRARHRFLSRPIPPQQLGEPDADTYLAKIREEGRDWLAPVSVPAHGDQVISPQTAFIMNHLLKSVVSYGTATRANRLKKPLAGKTGTTNNYRDAWFIGYSPELIAGVWVGADDYAYSLGHGVSGGKAALPIWIKYMEAMLADRDAVDFPIPRGIQWVRIDKTDGLRESDCSDPSNVRTDPFKKGTAPIEYHQCQATDSSGRDSATLELLERR